MECKDRECDRCKDDECEWSPASHEYCYTTDELYESDEWPDISSIVECGEKAILIGRYWILREMHYTSSHHDTTEKYLEEKYKYLVGSDFRHRGLG
jgi:hypothetical protein